jgi:hypothetical protein
MGEIAPLMEPGYGKRVEGLLPKIPESDREK